MDLYAMCVRQERRGAAETIRRLIEQRMRLAA